VSRFHKLDWHAIGFAVAWDVIIVIEGVESQGLVSGHDRNPPGLIEGRNLTLLGPLGNQSVSLSVLVVDSFFISSTAWSNSTECPRISEK
jgi:hypothetical protein